jgi:hypothetical protein
MTWFKVDDAFWGHPKQTALPPGPVALWVRAGSWSSDQLTDGLVPAHMVTMLGAKKRDAEQLVTAGLWDQVPEGYQFHDWNEWQPSRDDVLKKRAEEAEKKRKWREKRAAQRAAADGMSPDVSPGDNSGTPEGTTASVPGGVPDLSPSSRTRPDPTRPDPSSPTETTATSKTSVGGLTEVDARERPPLYSDRCSRHGNDPEPDPCGACADVRKANREHPPLHVVPANYCLVHDETFDRICRGCRADAIAAPEEESA